MNVANDADTIRQSLVAGGLDYLADGCPPSRTLLVTDIGDLCPSPEQVGLATTFRRALDRKDGLFDGCIALD